MVLALLAVQLVGLAVVYLALRRYLDRQLRRFDEAPELRSRVAELTAEMNAAAERNVTLLEDRIRRLDESLREADRHASRGVPEGHQAVAPAAAGGAGERVCARSPRDMEDDASRCTGVVRRPACLDQAQVVRLRRLGFSSAVIADRLATSQGEVELILNLAADRAPVPHRPDPRTATTPATRT